MKKFFHKVLPLVILSVVFAFTFALCSCTPTEPETPSVTYYSVTYSGTDMEDAQLAEGATIEKPANPTKAGQVFVGWYTDQSFDTQYSFGNTITGDVTIYARFVTPSDPEYAVTYVSDGEIVSTATTIGGMALNVPVPTKEGHEFIGWWVSDYEDASKLTYKYDEHVLGSDTTLYAVWDKANVSVTSSTITWPEKSATSNYKVEVKKGSTVIYTYNITGGTTYAYDFTKLEAGDYVIDVTVGGQTYSAYYKNKALNRVSGLKVTDGVLTYNAVPGATNYHVTVDCGNDTHQHAYFNNGDKLTYDFSDCSMQEGGIKFTVTATAEGYASSVSKEFSYEANLSAVTGVKVDEATATLIWDAVANAQYYVVKIGNDEIVAEDTTCSLKYYGAGEYTATVTAVAHGYNPSKAELTFTKTALSAPVDVTANGKTVTWTAVEGATGYKVKVNGTEFEVTDTTYTVEEVDGTLSIAVKAVKEGADSLYSDAVEISNVLGTISYDDGIISWASIVGASGYRIRVNGRDAGDVTTNYAPVTLTKKGNNTVTVIKMVDGEITDDSQSVFVKTYEVTFQTNGGDAIAPAYFADGDTIKGIDAKKYGYTLNSWRTTNNPENGQVINLDTYKVTKDVTIYAAWDAKDITVALNVVDGNAIEQTTVTLTYGQPFTLPVPTHENELMSFAGWYSDIYAEGVKYTDELGQSVNVWSLDRENVTIVAGWVNTLSYTLINQNKEYSVSAGLDIKKVTTVTIPATYLGLPVTTVEGSAFRNCDHLVTVNIPNTIQNVETGTAFLGCYSLMNINVYETTEIDVPEKDYYSIDGVLFYNNPYNEGKEIKSFPMARTGEYWIPEGIEVLPINVFRSSHITELHVASTVVKIDKNAFSSNTLTTIIFENGEVGAQTFYLDIAADAFGALNKLTSITFPQRLRSFDSACLTNCPRLNEIKMEGVGEYYAAEDGVLLSFDKSTIVYCPKAKTEYTIPSSVSTIGKGAFAGTKFNSVVIPANVTKIEEKAFFECVNLVNLEFKGTNVADGALEIQANAFGGCKMLTSVVLPANLTVLKTKAFADCSLLAKVTVNSGSEVTFETDAFYDADTTGSNITELIIGDNFYCNNIGGVFGGPNLEKITASATNPNFLTENNVLYAREKDNPNNLSIQYYPTGLRVTDFVINENVTVIGDRVFEGRKYLKSVTIPAKTVSIGANAFKDCIALETVTFANRTADLTIGDYAFLNCSALTGIELPNSLKSMGSYDGAGNIASMHVFDGCANLGYITVGTENTGFASVDGILYAKNSDGIANVLLLCPANNAETTVVIPATVTAIFDNAFKGNTTVQTVSFAATTVDETFSLGRYAFAEMKALQTVTFPEGIKVIGIGTFMDSAITSIEIPNSVNALAPNSFKNTTSLDLVSFKEDRTTGIALLDGGGTPPADWPENEPYDQKPGGKTDCMGVFVGSKVASITLPANSTIGKYAFAWATVKSIVIPEGVQEIKEGTFRNNSKLENVTFNSDLEEIGEEAFHSCTYLTAIDLPDSVKVVGDWAFYSCERVATLDLGRVEKIGEWSFAYLRRNLAGELLIPNSVKEINEAAFYGLAKVTSIKFEDDDENTTRERLTFNVGSTLSTFTAYNNSSTEVTSITFPNMNAPARIVIQQEDENKPNAVFSGLSKLTTVNLGSGVVSLANMFLGCDNLTTYNGLIGNPNFVIEDGVVYNASKTELLMATSDFAVEELIIPEGVQVIHAGAFAYNKTIKSVHFPKSITTIGEEAFIGCGNLAEIKWAEGFENDVKFGDACFRAWYNDDYTDIESSLTEIKLPASITTLSRYMFWGHKIEKITKDTMPGVKSLGSYTFADCWNLTSVDLSFNTELRCAYSVNGDQSMYDFGGQSAFNGCENLVDVKLPEGLNCIPNYFFADCSKLASLEIPSTVDEISSYAFRNTALTSVVIPDTVFYVGGEAFTGCKNITTVTLGANLYQMQYRVFDGCTSLTSVTINGKPELWGQDVFNGCTSLTNVTINPEGGLEIVGDTMFRNLPITSIVLPDTVKYIGEEAFAGCTSLTSLNIPDALTTVGANAFKNTLLSGEIYVPAGVETIAPGAFAYMPNVTDFVVDMGNAIYTSDEYGIIYDLTNAIVAYPSGNARTEWTVKDEITTINGYAFAGANLTKLNVPAEVTKIGMGAFAGWMKNQTLVFEVSREDGVHYGEDWRVGTKCKKFWSAGAEEEPLGYWMSDEHNPDEIWSKLDALAENGYYIELKITGFESYPEWDEYYDWSSGEFVARKGHVVQGGYLDDTMTWDGGTWIYDLTGLMNYTDAPMWTIFSGYDEDISRSDNEMTWDPSSNENDAKWNSLEEKIASEYDRLIKSVRGYGYNATEDSIGSGVYDYMLRYVDFDEEMTRKEITYIGRPCYEYTFTLNGHLYTFIFDKETGLCFRGESLDDYGDWQMGEIWEVTAFSTNHTITLPDIPAEEA